MKFHFVHKLRVAADRLTLYKEEHFLKKIYVNYIEHNPRVDHILNLKVNDSIKDLIRARDLPSTESFQENEWRKKMFLRYGLAMRVAKGKDVLETCSGLGWGAYLLDDVAGSVNCIELDRRSIDLSKQLWKTEKTEYINASVIQIPIMDATYDIVTAMESIEHFRLGDIKTYLSEMYRILKPGGILIGSSAFPNTIEEADALCSENEYHLYICTKREIIDLLRENGFKNIRIFQNLLYFIARK